MNMTDNTNNSYYINILSGGVLAILCNKHAQSMDWLSHLEYK